MASRPARSARRHWSFSGPSTSIDEPSDFSNRPRNRIVHEGARADGDDAVASLEAVRAITWRLHQIVLTRTGREPEFEEDERVRREGEGEPPRDEP